MQCVCKHVDQNVLARTPPFLAGLGVELYFVLEIWTLSRVRPEYVPDFLQPC